MASGAGQSAVVTLLLDHGADVHAGTAEVGDYSTALCVVLLLHDNIIRVCMYVGYLKTSFHTYFMPLLYITVDVHWYSTIHHRTRRLLSTMPVKVVIMTL